MNETISIFVSMYYTTITKEVFFLGGGVEGKEMGGGRISHHDICFYIHVYSFNSEGMFKAYKRHV